MIDLLAQLALLVIAFLANLLSALAGGGAGLVQLPALIFLGLPFAVALATHKVASVFLGLGATARHAQSARLAWRFAGFILLCGLPGVVLGAIWVLTLPAQWAELALGVLTIAAGVYSARRPALGQVAAPRHRQGWPLLVGGAVLFLIGALNGSLTSGTGLFVTLWLVRWFGLAYSEAVAYTLVLVGLFWNGAGALTLGLHGQIYWLWLPALILGSLAGGYFGAHLAITRGSALVKRVFEVTTLLVGLGLIVRNLPAVSRLLGAE